MKMVYVRRITFHNQNIAGFCLIIALFITACCLTFYNRPITFEENQNPLNDSNRGCNLFSGKWVYDDKSHPQYNDTQCSFMFEEYACEKYGRKDLKYQKWRWQPHGCDLPRFNGASFMEKIRGKKLIFVGDSLNKNQWTSLLCLIESSIPSSSSKSVIQEGNLFTFHAIEYNATIGFYWSPFLVESNNDDPMVHRERDRTVRIHSIEKHARQWNDADILIFDSFVWWTDPTMTLLWGSFGSSDAIYKRVEMGHRRYEMALNTWSDWLEININRTKTKGENYSVEQHCYNETEPILEEYWGATTDHGMMHAAESSIRKLESRGLKVQYLNITQLSDYRKDAHPSIYRIQHDQLITEEQLKDPKSYSDCIHWCLPGFRVHANWKRGIKCYDIAGLFFIAFVIVPLYLSLYHGPNVQVENVVKRQQQEPIPGVERNDESTSSCNLFSGKWIFDEQSYPLYKEGDCSFIHKDFGCEMYGRKDLKYQSWRWQPHDCDLPRFNGTALLEKIRGKKLIYVGDSLNRNQWTSMLCLIESSLPPSSNKIVNLTGNFFIFEANDYNATIAFYWSPFLVESNNDHPYVHRLRDRVIGVKSIEKHARNWNDADILVFDSFMWWLEPKMTLMWGSFGSTDAVYKKVEMKLRRYEMALNTWSEWLEININRTKTKLFFMSLSPYHDIGESYEDKQNCYNESEPISKEGYWGVATDHSMMQVAESTIKKLQTRGVKMEYLNITQMSDYRRDAHPSIYRRYFNPITEEQLRNPRDYSDCRWQKKKTQLPFLVLIFFMLIAFSIFYSESNIQEILHNQSHRVNRIQDGSFLSKPTQDFVLPNKPSVVLNRSSTCGSTVKYSGRRAFPTASTAGSVGQRAVAETKTCDLFSGNWVFDNKSYPLYNESKCPYMSDQLACHKHGRSDLDYQFWRWQPQNCNLKRWNAKEMWEKLRGKRLMFVGDSLNRGQWISMLCLLHSTIPPDKQSITPNSELTIFRAENYNATIEFLWAPLLVESNSDDPVDHRTNERILRPDAILRHSSRWEHADILVFNSYLWWRQGPVKLLWSNEENSVCEEISGLGGMELAMEAWGDWVASHVDPLKKKVFFITMSPTHLTKEDWERGSEGNCYNEKVPINDERYWGSGSDLPTMRMVEKVLSRLGSKVSVLNITQLSEYRKDGHPSIHRKFWEALSSENLANPASYSDCIHWCLPGVPDVWNELLFQFL
ncbi:hypothetical protein ACJIZ3_019027 [Penstemon smallii]|uniref:Trichome birefringence-like N-terminal domain-containing protein n=1 Tax=Penstemon smallii TaxID=265156 RepID=A0ABD3T025_9LAMI